MIENWNCNPGASALKAWGSCHLDRLQHQSHWAHCRRSLHLHIENTGSQP
jgi:hypothetical protein